MSTEETKINQQETSPISTPEKSSGDVFPPDTSPVKKKFDKRTILEIAVGAIALLTIIGLVGGPSQEEYDKLKKKYDTQTQDLDNLQTEYYSYKNDMKKFDDLTDEEADALLAKVDEITAEKKAKEEEERKAAEQAAAEEAAKQQTINSASMSQRNALEKAKDYLDFSAFSYTGLIGQLEYEGFSTEDATFGADNCGADWNEQAAKKAQSYLDFSSFSRQGLVDQLLYEGFTNEQAEYSVTAVGY